MHTSKACHICRQGNSEVDLSIRTIRLGIVQRDLAARTIGIAGKIKIASKRASAHGTTLVDSHSYHAAFGDRGDGLVCQNIFGRRSDVNVTGEHGPSTFVRDVISDLSLIDNICIRRIGQADLQPCAYKITKLGFVQCLSESTY